MKRRIQRVARDEKVIVPMLSEPLQELYERVQDMGDKAENLKEEIEESLKQNGGDQSKVPFDLLREFERERIEVFHQRALMWFKIQDQYNIWSCDNIGIRDGYAIVAMKFRPSMNMLKDFKRFMEEMPD